MENKYQIIGKKVLEGTKRAVEKLVIQSHKDNIPLVVSSSKNGNSKVIINTKSTK